MKEIVKYVSVNGLEYDTKEEAAVMDFLVMENAVKVIANYCKNNKDLCANCPFMGERMCKFYITDSPIETDENSPKQWDI